MRCLLLLLVFPCFATAICLRFVNPSDTQLMEERPGHVWRWNANTSEFDKLEALTLNGTAFCSVNAVSDLRGKMLTVGISPINPFILQNKDKTGVTGFIGDLWTNVEEVLGFKTIYRRVREAGFMMLMNGDIHAMLIASAMIDPVNCYYDYSLSFITNSYALFAQTDGEEASKTWYLDTFSGDLWLTAFIFVLCITCSVMGTYYVRKLICADYMEFHDELSSPLFSLLYVLSGISGQGFQKIPRCWSLRLVLLSCLILGLLLSCGFSSNLISNLTNRKYSVPFANLEDVAIKRTHTLCVRNTSSAYLYFTDQMLGDEIKDEWKGLVNHGCPDLTGNENPVVELCQPGFVYLESPEIFRLLYNKVQRNCSIVQLPETYWNRKLTILYAKTGQFRRIVDMSILRMRTAGILNYLKRKWMSMDTYDLRPGTLRPVEYEHIHLAFCVFFTMIVVSGFICVLENVWYGLRLKRGKISPTSVLPRTRARANANMSKVCRKSRPTAVVVRRCQTIRSTPETMRDPECLLNVTVTRMSRLGECRTRDQHWAAKSPENIVHRRFSGNDSRARPLGLSARGFQEFHAHSIETNRTRSTLM